MKECVVTFNDGVRKISMYIKDTEDGGLDLQMAVNPEFQDGETPDLPTALANVFLKALNPEDKSENVYAGEN